MLTKLHVKKGNGMKKAIVLDSNDIKAILAEKYGVPEKNVIKSQYSYTIAFEEEKGDDGEWLTSQ